jgi:hypothetical protein
LDLKLIIVNDPLDFKIIVDGSDSSIYLNGRIQFNPLTNYFSSEWIGWITDKRIILTPLVPTHEKSMQIYKLLCKN